MAEITLPEAIDLGEAYGRVDWSVRAIWESYTGWFHQRSTLDLFGAAPEYGARELVTLAGGASELARRAASLAATDPLTAIRLCEVVFAGAGEDPAALHAYRRAHERLLEQHGRENFWMTKWLEGEVRSAANRLARVQVTDVPEAPQETA
jgi:alkyl sulfatase BDS1-like metallo-beta-lactamase superfamily hydrolase